MPDEPIPRAGAMQALAYQPPPKQQHAMALARRLALLVMIGAATGIVSLAVRLGIGSPRFALVALNSWSQVQLILDIVAGVIDVALIITAAGCRLPAPQRYDATATDCLLLGKSWHLAGAGRNKFNR